MNLKSVYLPSIPYIKVGDNFLPSLDFSNALIFGEIKVILDRDDVIYRYAEIAKKIRLSLDDFKQDDYFLPIGDLIVVGMCLGYLLRRFNMIQVLKWDKKTRTYAVVNVKI